MNTPEASISQPSRPFPTRIACVGISHQSASVEEREAFAVSATALPGAIAGLLAQPGIAEAVIVSTCNRVEYYVAAAEPFALETLRGFVERRSDERAGSKPLPSRFYALEGEAAMAHLFRVVSGLESMVIGETEILGQVKKAYAAAAECGGTGRHLNKLFQRAFNVAKEVRTQTAITRGPVSVGSAAVELAERIFGRLAACRVMILGAGETGELTARALLSRGVKTVFVANRTHARAAALAAEMGGEALHFDAAQARWHDVDILISSTAAPRYIVTPERLAPVLARRRERPLFLIDLAVPRDIDPAVNALEGAYLYDIDSLQAIAQQGLESRRQETAACEARIARHVAEFAQWLRTPIPSGFGGDGHAASTHAPAPTPAPKIPAL